MRKRISETTINYYKNIGQIFWFFFKLKYTDARILYDLYSYIFILSLKKAFRQLISSFSLSSIILSRQERRKWWIRLVRKCVSLIQSNTYSKKAQIFYQEFQVLDIKKIQIFYTIHFTKRNCVISNRKIFLKNLDEMLGNLKWMSLRYCYNIWIISYY